MRDKKDRKTVAKRLLEDIDLALRANNQSATAEWRRDHCRCDRSVGQCPCDYCAVHDALRRSRDFVKGAIGGAPPRKDAAQPKEVLELRRRNVLAWRKM